MKKPNYEVLLLSLLFTIIYVYYFSHDVGVFVVGKILQGESVFYREIDFKLIGIFTSVVVTNVILILRVIFKSKRKREGN